MHTLIYIYGNIQSRHYTSVLGEDGWTCIDLDLDLDLDHSGLSGSGSTLAWDIVLCSHSAFLHPGV